MRIALFDLFARLIASVARPNAVCKLDLDRNHLRLMYMSGYGYVGINVDSDLYTRETPVFTSVISVKRLLAIAQSLKSTTSLNERLRVTRARNTLKLSNGDFSATIIPGVQIYPDFENASEEYAKLPLDIDFDKVAKLGDDGPYQIERNAMYTLDRIQMSIFNFPESTVRYASRRAPHSIVIPSKMVPALKLLNEFRNVDDQIIIVREQGNAFIFNISTEDDIEVTVVCLKPNVTLPDLATITQTTAAFPQITEVIVNKTGFMQIIDNVIRPAPSTEECFGTLRLPSRSTIQLELDLSGASLVDKCELQHQFTLRRGTREADLHYEINLDILRKHVSLVDSNDVTITILDSQNGKVFKVSGNSYVGFLMGAANADTTQNSRGESADGPGNPANRPGGDGNEAGNSADQNVQGAGTPA